MYLDDRRLEVILGLFPDISFNDASCPVIALDAALAQAAVVVASSTTGVAC